MYLFHDLWHSGFLGDRVIDLVDIRPDGDENPLVYGISDRRRDPDINTKRIAQFSGHAFGMEKTEQDIACDPGDEINFFIWNEFGLACFPNEIGIGVGCQYLAELRGQAIPAIQNFLVLNF
jgi:hypothetical protein